MVDLRACWEQVLFIADTISRGTSPEGRK